MDDFARDRKTPARQLLSWGLVVLLHLLLAWLIQSGLGHKVLEQIKKPVEVVLLQLEAPTPAPEPPPKPNEATPPPPKASTPPPAPLTAPLEVPVTQIPQAQPAVTPAPNPPAAAPPTAPSPPAPVIQAPAPPATPKAAAPSTPPAPVRTAAVVSASHCKKPEYPKASLDLDEEGTVHLRFFLAVDGKVSRSEVEKSSGSRRLDEAARAGLSLCQFKPGTVDGKPEPTWVKIIYTWTLD